MVAVRLQQCSLDIASLAVAWWRPSTRQPKRRSRAICCRWGCKTQTFKHRRWQAWKTGQPPMDQCTPRYKPQPPPEDLPRKAELPTLKVCQMVDNRLVLPKDTRAMFLTCPIHGHEWREILQSFDASWSAPLSTRTEGSPSPVKTETAGSPVKTEMKVETGAFDWGSVFPGEADSLDKVKEKFGGDNVLELVGPVSGTVFLVTPGPALYLMAKEAVEVKGFAQPICTHGAGTWLLGEKSKKFQVSNPGKGYLCQWDSDQARVVLEDGMGANSYLCLKPSCMMFHDLLAGQWCRRPCHDPPCCITSGGAFGHDRVQPRRAFLHKTK